MQGCLVTVSDRTQRTLDETVELMRDAGSDGAAVQSDLTDEESAARAVGEAAGADADGRIGFALNSAGVFGETTSSRSPAALVSSSTAWSTTTFLAMKHELGYILPLGHGSIVNIASAAGVVGAPGLAAYAAAKLGQIGLTRTAALDYGPRGIRLNAIPASLVDTWSPRAGRRRSPAATESCIGEPYRSS